MAGIISSGVGSGIDITSLVSQLVQAEGAPQLNRLNTTEAKLQSQLSAVGTLKGALSDFQSSLSGLSNLSSFQSLTATSGNTAVYTASASAGASNGTHSVEVINIATAHKVAFKAFTDVVGTGSLTFQFGTYNSGTFTPNASKSSSTVTIGASNNSLEGIRSAVNNANVGVSAGIINDGSGNRLIFTSTDSGAANSLKITISGDSDTNNTNDTGLSQLAYDPTSAIGTGKNMQQTIPAKNASLMVDGLAITSTSNIVTGAISGVTMNLLSSSPGNASTLSVSRNTAAITTNVQNFVSKYNTLGNTIKNLSGYDASTNKGGVLLGDATLRHVDSQIRSTLGSMISNLSGQYKSLTSIGVSFQKDGSLLLDSGKLAAALNNAPDSVGRIFSDGGDTTDALLTYKRSTESSKVGNYAIHVTQAAAQGFYRGEVPISPTLDIKENNNTFSLNVNGAQSGSISLTPKLYASNADLAMEMQTRINGDSALKAKGVSVAVDYDTDHFTITSSAYGAGSKVSIIAANTKTRANLGFSMGTGTQGVYAGGAVSMKAATQGFYTGGVVASSPINIDDDNNNFSLSVNGIQSGSINLTSNLYTSNNDLAVEMQTRINDDSALKEKGISVVVGYNTDHFTITSSSYGKDSKVDITAVDANTEAKLGLKVGAGTVGEPAFMEIDDDNNNFSLSVNGVQSGSINITKKSYYNYVDLAAEMQTRINADASLKAKGVSVEVGYETDHFTLTSSSYGKDSKVDITSIDMNTTADLGLSVANGTVGKSEFYAGKIASSPTLDIGETNNTFSLNVNGVQSGGINLTQKTYDNNADLAVEMQTRINEDAALKEKKISVTVAYDIDHFTITSKEPDVGYKVNITSVDTSTTANLGITLGNEVAGKDVAGSIGGTPAAQGFYTGKVATTPTLTIDDMNNTFSLNVNGVESGSIGLMQKTYDSNADLAVEMQTRINADAALKAKGVSVAVSYDSDHFKITSSAYGANSKINITAVNTNTATDLGLSAGSGTVGKDVTGANVATGFGQLLTGTAGDSVGLQMEVRGTTTGGRGNVSFNRGIASQLNTLIGRFMNSSTGSITNRTSEINSTIKNINTQRTMINERLLVMEKRYLTQFNAMDAIVASMKDTGTYLTQQFFSNSNSN